MKMFPASPTYSLPARRSRLLPLWGRLGRGLLLGTALWLSPALVHPLIPTHPAASSDALSTIGAAWAQEEDGSESAGSGQNASDDPANSSEPLTAEQFAQTVDDTKNFISWRHRAENILKKYPDDFRGYALLGWVMHRSEGDLPRAGYLLKKAAEGARKANDRRYYYQLLLELQSVMGEMDDYEAQIGYLDKLLDLVDNKGIEILKAWPLMKLDHEDQAREIINRGLKSGNPGINAMALNTLGALESEKGNFTESEKAFRTLLQNYHSKDGSSEITFLRNLGEALLALNRYDEAEKCFNQATKLPYDGTSLSNPYMDLAHLYLREARYSEARSAGIKMVEWSKCARPYLYQQTMADNSRVAAEFGLNTGFNYDALDFLELMASRPDRRFGTSTHPDQSETGNLLLYYIALHRCAEDTKEDLPTCSLWERIPKLLYLLKLQLKSWDLSRRINSKVIEYDRLYKTFIHYSAGGIQLSDWEIPYFIRIMGKGTSQAALEYIAQEGLDKLYDNNKPFYDASMAFILDLQGHSKEAAQYARQAITTLPKQEKVLIGELILLNLKDSDNLHTQEGKDAVIQIFNSGLAPLLRDIDLPLPVRLEHDSSYTAKLAAKMLERSPRFTLSSDPVFNIAIASPDAKYLEITLTTYNGDVLFRKTTDNQYDLSDKELAGIVVRSFNNSVFSAKIAFSDLDLNGLDGSNLSGSVSGDVLHSLF